MPEHIICDLCNKSIHKAHKKRHQDSKNCLDNRHILKEIKHHLCKYCKKQFNRLDKKNTHEESCKHQSIYYKYQLELKIKELESKDIELKSLKESKDNELQSKNNELKSKDNIIKLNEDALDEKDHIIVDLRNQLFVLQKARLEPTHYTYNNNITNIIYNINIDFNDIQNHLHLYDINVLSDKTKILDFIFGIFGNKIILYDEKKRIITYFHENKNIKDKQCIKFLQLSARQLLETSQQLCDTNMKIMDNIIMKRATDNKYMLINMNCQPEKFIRTIIGNKYINEIIRRKK